MNKKDFFEVTKPLLERLYRVAFNLLPDDLQAEQLVIDSLNACLIKEKKSLEFREIDLSDKKALAVDRKQIYKTLLRYMSQIGIKRSVQLFDQMRLNRPVEYKAFFDIDPTIRLVLTLRYEQQFNVDEITDIMQLPRYEIIEKLHNGRFLMLNKLSAGVDL